MRLRTGDPSRQPVRRFDHAHRIAPTGPAGGARTPAGRRRDRRDPGGRRPGAAGILSIAVIALAAVVIRPWDAILGSANGPASTDAVAGATDGGELVPRSSLAPGAIGPHGDPVTGPEPTLAATSTVNPSPRTDPAEASQEPTPSPLLPGYQWPMRHARITNVYGAGRPSSFLLDGEEFHDGIDIASFCGARITAAHAGVVLGAGRRTQDLLGWVGDLSAFRAKVDEENAWRSQAITVVIDDGNGYRSIYAHLGLATVEEGQAVEAGDLIGWEGASGNATGCHLHYALFNPDETDTLALDPKIAKRTLLPPEEIARIDPQLVFPPPETADLTWGWGSR